MDAGELLELVTAVFERCGMSNADAALLADSLVDADLGGTHSHGVLRAPGYVEQLTTQGVNPTAKPEVVRDGPSFV
ncbi:MAG: Ldh family oxidoreductase, partial [Gemmatimonadota bacterium]|nr:Ldh family oxidoreductase [Gemmatimonadota bacterium]